MISSFYTRQLEVVLVGLENSGKTTLMNGESVRAENVLLLVHMGLLVVSSYQYPSTQQYVRRSGPSLVRCLAS